MVDSASLHTCDLLRANYLLKNGLYCTIQAHFHLLFGQLLRELKSSRMGCVQIFHNCVDWKVQAIVHTQYITGMNGSSGFAFFWYRSLFRRRQIDELTTRADTKCSFSGCRHAVCILHLEFIRFIGWGHIVCSQSEAPGPYLCLEIILVVVSYALWCIHTCDFLNYCVNPNF